MLLKYHSQLMGKKTHSFRVEVLINVHDTERTGKRLELMPPLIAFLKIEDFLNNAFSC